MNTGTGGGGRGGVGGWWGDGRDDDSIGAQYAVSIG